MAHAHFDVAPFYIDWRNVLPHLVLVRNKITYTYLYKKIEYCRCDIEEYYKGGLSYSIVIYITYIFAPVDCRINFYLIYAEGAVTMQKTFDESKTMAAHDAEIFSINHFLHQQ